MWSLYLVTLPPWGIEGIETRHLYAAVGSSVFFPGEKIDNFTFYDFRKGSLLIVTCHHGCSVRDPYNKRGDFFQHNGTFLLNELRVEDSGIFEYEMNFTMKRQIHLHVMAPVMEPVLLLKENRSHCLVIFTCRAEGGGPLNFTFMRNDNEIVENAVSLDNSISLSMDGSDPKTSGRFSCIVRNMISSQTSPAVELLPPVTLKLRIMRLFVIGFLCHWISAVCILCMKYICKKWRKENQEEEEIIDGPKTLQSQADQHKGPRYRDTVNKDRTLSLVSRTFSIVDRLLGFLKELAVLVICVDGEIIPGWVCFLPVIFLLCRVFYWIFFFINKSRKLNIRAPHVVEVAMTVSNLIVVPAFCMAVLVILFVRYRSACGTMDISLVVLFHVCALIFIFYLWMKSKVKGKLYIPGQQGQPESQQLVNMPNGDKGPSGSNGVIRSPEDNGVIRSPEDNGNIGSPKDIRNPNCEGPVPPGIVENPNLDQEAPVQSEVFAEEHSEDQMIPDPEKGQPKVPKEVPCNSHVTDLTIDMEVEVDKGPVANG
ncbi:unnamed protein product [Staurois parvus]|uniref:Ig-like domain-containing protein n=1 Tax=Staurois parvus TaxID=386267 RepID=A0ABN9H506_9NEOB|nr:unnamed protein product [Staurois parvus]